MSQPLNFQQMILNLQRYWAEQGCLIWQPYYSQVGAGTYNPATYLRVLGPEPWNVGYVEPSVRPDDGRYGDNPNRLQQHYQFQVILKPDPGNPQELYLRSLEALEIDPRWHDIRFVEDNWESPALGAWGLGWEVWMDGQEITQFTYFQQAGGMPLEPVSVEITYGLERIAMALQGVRHFRNIQWNDQRKYGDVNLQAEQEHSKYYFEIADVDRLRAMYDLYEAEANAALQNNLVLPAHDYVLKCSHTFNILDTRGAVGVTERQALFARMRDLSRRVAEAYYAQRQGLEFPWLEAAQDQGSAVETPETVAAPPTVSQVASTPADFLLEIGTEELPAADLDAALAQLSERVPALLEELRLEHGEVRVLGTPRRLVVWVAGLSAAQAERTMLVKGPPVSRAFDAQGVPTKAAEGFARGRGIAVSDLQVRDVDGGSYVVAEVHEVGRPAVQVLVDVLPGLVAGLRFDKAMRWNDSGVTFSRPIRWLLAMIGEQVVPFAYAGLVAGQETRGLRFAQVPTFRVQQPAEYFTALAQEGILLDPAQRRETIAEQVQLLQQEVGGEAELDPALLDEVTQLVEAPTALRGTFAEEHLRLPPEVLISVMKKHQRYFPVKANGQLMPYFIGVRNGGEQHLDVVTDGNEQVIRARFADAAFFIREDLQKKLEDFLPRLATLTFQFKLGSMFDKSQRIERLVEKLVAVFAVSAEDAAVARRAAQLSKADLVTNMVVEMTSVQGVMGRFYALQSGEPQAVAQAIFEHYLPRSTGDVLPTSLPGLLVGLADRFDTLAGLFAVGLAPTGTKDPFAQRRAALGLVQILGGRSLDFDLRQGLAMAAEGLPVAAESKTLQACLDFIVARMRSYLMEQQGYRFDVVDAVLAEQQANPAGVFRTVQGLAQWVQHPDWSAILAAYARCVRITRDQKQHYEIAPSAFRDPVEGALYAALPAQSDQPLASLEDFFSVFLPMVPLINRFFEAVLVMDEDAVVRANRLGLLQSVAALSNGLVDFSKMEGF